MPDQPLDAWAAVDLHDQRIARGLQRQGRARALALAEGRAHVGWKVGWNTPAARSALDVGSSVIGYLVDAFGPRVSLAGTSRPAAEVELAIVMSRDVAAGATAEEALAAVRYAAPAIEVLDVTTRDVEDAVAANVWHRGVVLGNTSPWEPELLDTLVTAQCAGDRLQALRPREAIHDLGALLKFVAGAVTATGGLLRAGDVVITGNLLVEPLPVAPGCVLEAEMAGLGPVRADFA